MEKNGKAKVGPRPCFGLSWSDPVVQRASIVMKIILSRYPGICYGIRRATRLVQEELKARKGKNIKYIEPVFRSRMQMERLESQGLEHAPDAASLTKDDLLVLPVFGASAELVDDLFARGIPILNTTCPRASMGHNLAFRLAREGYVVLVVGKPQSFESQVLLSHARKGWQEKLAGLEKKGRVFFRAMTVQGDNEEIDFTKVPEDVTHVAVLGQPEASLLHYRRVVGAAAQRFEEVRAYNTICRSIAVRLQEASRMATSCDAMVVVGEACLETDMIKEACQASHRQVQVASGPKELDLPALEGCSVLGVCVATATPDWALVGVVEELRRFSGAEVMEGPLTA